MVGPWPLAPHHDHLQYVHHIHLMQRGQNQGITILLISTESIIFTKRRALAKSLTRPTLRYM